MDVLIVSHLYPRPTEERYGVFVHRQAKALRRRGHAVRVVAPTPWAPPALPLRERWGRHRQTPTKRVVEGIPIRYPRYPSLPHRRSLPINARLARIALTRTLRRVTAEGRFSPDVINAHVILPDAYATVPTAEELGVPLVTTVHGADFYAHADVPGCKSLMREVIDRSDYLLLNSPQLRDRGEAIFDGDLGERTVVPNGVPMNTIEAARNITPTHISVDQPTVVSAGDLIERKRHDLVLDALARLDEPPHFLSIGSGPQRDALEARAASLDIRERVTFVSEIADHAEFFAHIRAADLFALPSVNEAFGVVFIEAMACGTPVVACHGEGPASFIEDGETGFLVPPDDPEALAAVFERYLSNPEQYRGLRDQARRVVEESFTWDANARRLENIYCRVVEKVNHDF